MLHLAQGMPTRLKANRADAQVRAYQSALRLYQGACMRGWLGKIWAAFTRQPRHLISLTGVRKSIRIDNSYSIGVQTVPIEQIRGSQGRCRDFDSAFYPLQPHTGSRWLRIASACKQGIGLPPVELTQVGEIYFVRDGHHRISVARALGQTDIEAEVKVWQSSS